VDSFFALYKNCSRLFLSLSADETQASSALTAWSCFFSAGVFRNSRPLSYLLILKRNTFCWFEWRRRLQRE